MTKADIQYHLDNIGIEMEEIMVDLNGGGLSETSNGLLNDRHSELESMLERGKQAMADLNHKDCPDCPRCGSTWDDASQILFIVKVSNQVLFREVAVRAPADPQERGAWFGRIQALADRHNEPPA